MGTDSVRLFDTALARRLLGMDLGTLRRFLAEHGEALEDRERLRFALQLQRALPSTPLEELKADAHTSLGLYRSWLDGGEEDAGLRWELTVMAASGAEEVHLDYWGCAAEVFPRWPPEGALSSLALRPDAEVEDFLLLQPVHVDAMLASLHAHRRELRVMREQDLERLAAMRDACARSFGHHLAYFPDT